MLLLSYFFHVENGKGSLERRWPSFFSPLLGTQFGRSSSFTLSLGGMGRNAAWKQHGRGNSAFPVQWSHGTQNIRVVPKDCVSEGTTFVTQQVKGREGLRILRHFSEVISIPREHFQLHSHSPTLVPRSPLFPLPCSQLFPVCSMRNILLPPLDHPSFHPRFRKSLFPGSHESPERFIPDEIADTFAQKLFPLRGASFKEDGNGTWNRIVVGADERNDIVMQSARERQN